jgi:hypothetical protein
MQTGRLCTPPPLKYLYDHSDFQQQEPAEINKYYNNLGTEHWWYQWKDPEASRDLFNYQPAQFVFTSSNGCPFQPLNLLELICFYSMQYVEHFCWHANPTTLMAKMEFWIILTLQLNYVDHGSFLCDWTDINGISWLCSISSYRCVSVFTGDLEN